MTKKDIQAKIYRDRLIANDPEPRKEIVIKKLDRNTYLVENSKVILYETTILEQQGKEIIINNGGYDTVTTKDRINKFIDKRYTVFQKNFEWYIKDSKNDKVLEYNHNMKVKGILNI